jgi:hypothetical protein
MIRPVVACIRIVDLNLTERALSMPLPSKQQNGKKGTLPSAKNVVDDIRRHHLPSSHGWEAEKNWPAASCQHE